MNLSSDKAFFLSILISIVFPISFQYEFVVFKNDTNVKRFKLQKRQATTNIPEIKEFLVNTNVANRFAETTIVSKVVNKDSSTKQTAFSVVLPERAFISGFYMETGGTRYTAYVKEKEEARKLFGQSLSTGQTAGHVSVSTRYSNRFTVNVNIEPLSKVTFNLKYEELLQREQGQYEIITSIHPGQIVKKLKVQVKINESLPLLFVRTPLLRSGSNALLNYNANLDPHAKVRLSNTSAWIIFEPDIERQLEFACAGLGNKKYQGFAGQFVVKYDVDRNNEGGESIYQDGFLLNFFAPKSLDPLPKHMVFVLDTSGSMDGLKMIQLIDAMEKILPQLNDEDVFSIVQYATNVHVWDLDSMGNDVLEGNPEFITYGNLAEDLKNNYVPPAHEATTENINKVKVLIKNLFANDATNSIGGLEIGLMVIQREQEQNPNKYTPILVFLTDGLPNVGISSMDAIIEKVITINKRGYNTPIYSLCFGLDDETGWSFLEKLSLSSEGKPKKITATSDSSLFLQDFYKMVSTPLLSNVSFYNLPDSVESTKTNFGLYFNGSELVFAAKGIPSNNAKPITVSAKGKNGTVNLEAQLGVPLTKIEKVWAYLTVKQLIDQYKATGNTKFQQLALNLALNYTLVSDYTSLIVIKPDSEGSAVETQDAEIGIFPEPPAELPLCNDIPDWINQNYGTTEPDFTEPISTTEEFPMGPNEATIGVMVDETTTQTPATTTTTMATTTEKIITCKESTYGCCYDGITFAPGPNGDGCDPIPNSESCSLPSDRGSCNNETLKWFYSNSKHLCRLFRYSGCGGNGNRFSTKENCETTCVSPEGTDRCKLPISLGMCNKKVMYWFYDKNKDECVKYMYGGCFGNSNRFKSKQECLNLCSPTKWQKTVKDLCYQPKDKGLKHCRRFEKNYYFDSSSGQCSKFWFTGCGGNDNRFTNKDVCEKMCIYPKNRAICHTSPPFGNCGVHYESFYFDTKTSSCKSFSYGGCGGNKNKFHSLEECEHFCVGP